MNKITKIIEAKNIEIIENGIRSIDGNFLLKFKMKCDFDKVGLQDFYFILEESAHNNFNFSVYKDYNKKEIELCIEGNSADQSFYILGYEYGEDTNEITQ